MLRPYRTPWCEMIGCMSGETTDILHLYYPLSLLKEEVHKRTSYLGKHRSTETAPHLLDLIGMTEDEADLFLSYVRTAMSKVFDPIGKHSRKVDKAYRWEANATTITMTKGVSPAITYCKGDYIWFRRELYLATGYGDSDTLENLAPTADYRESVHYIIQWAKTLNPNFIEPLDQAVQDAIVYYVIYQWLLSAYPADAEAYLAQYAEAIGDVRKYANRLLPEVVSRVPRIF